MYGGSQPNDTEIHKKVNDIIRGKMHNLAHNATNLVKENSSSFMMLMPILKIAFMVLFIFIFSPQIKNLVKFFDLNESAGLIYVQWATLLIILWTFLPTKSTVL